VLARVPTRRLVVLGEWGTGKTMLMVRLVLDLLARREPQVKHIMTSNAETNGHMIGINETLGYRVIGPPERSWELPAAQVIGPAQP